MTEDPKARRAEATARFHEKVARAYAAHGDNENAKAARKAARKARNDR